MCGVFVLQYYTTSQLSENIKETPEGYLLCLNVPIARTGELLYSAKEIVTPDGEQIFQGDASGMVRINRTAAELFSPETIASFEGKPACLLHPGRDDNGYPILLNPDNWDEYTRGIMQGVRQGEGDQGDCLVADLLLTKPDAIEAVKLGLRQVSCGYNAEWVLDDESTGHQESIRGNHVALVPSGRCGSDCAIQDHEKPQQEKNNMNKWERIKAKFPGLAAFIDSILPEEKIAAASADDAGNDAEKEKTEDATTTEAATQDMPGDVAANISQIVADLQQQLAWCKTQIEEGLERQQALEAVLAKLNVAAATDTEAPATDTAPDHDTISRAEILSPGVAATADMAAVALKGFYATTDGKEIIDTLAGGEAPAFDDTKLFVAVSEIVKAKRTAGLSGTIAAADEKPAGSWHDNFQKAVNDKWTA